MEIIIPEFKKSAFNCPYCFAYAHQTWTELTLKFYNNNNESTLWDDKQPAGGGRFHYSNQNKPNGKELWVARCSHCNKYSLWSEDTLIIPSISPLPQPNTDLPDNITEIYKEAINVYQASPRSSAALLRLVLQMLLIHLGEKGDKINDDIKNLVKKGVPEMIQQAADTLRYVGNQAVHPGTIDFEDNSDTVQTLFIIINTIAYHMLTLPKQIKNQYQLLPESVRNNIDKRDNK